MADWSGFHRLTAQQRLERVATAAKLTAAERAALASATALPLDLANQFIENAIGAFPLPLGFAVHLVVDGDPVVAPMAVEESRKRAG